MSVRGAPRLPAGGTLSDWVRYAERRFAAARLAFGHGTSNAHDEALWLLVHVLKIDFDDVARSGQRVLGGCEANSAQALIERRIETRKPLAYLLHEAWLAGLRFHVDERVLVPRSFIAELLPEGLSPWLRGPEVRDVLDLCTGSGCLAVLAARAYPNARVAASDISSAALAVARRNVLEHRLARRIRLVKSDLFAELPRRSFDLILSNPPYVREGSMRTLPPEYRAEPMRALTGGRDGLQAVMRILEEAPRFLAPHGVLVMEIGHNRHALERRAPGIPFTWLETSAGEDMLFLVTREELVNAGAEGAAGSRARSRPPSRRGWSRKPR